MRENIASISINTSDGKSTIRDLAGHEIPYLQVLSNLDSDWNYNPSKSDSSSEEESSTAELYRKVLHRAWKDDKVSDDERKMLEDIAIQLGLEPSVVENIEKEVMEERGSSKDLQKNTFLEVLSVAWQDGYISEDEQAMLDSLSTSLGLDSDYASEIQKDWIKENS